MALTNRAYLDGLDIWTNFGVAVENGSANFLRYPPKKDSIMHDWLDENGIDVDLSAVFFKEREVQLNCFIIAFNEADFLVKQANFIGQLTKPGLHRIEYTSHGNRQYFVFYKECSIWKQVAALKGKSGEEFVGHKFTITLVEPNPGTAASTVTFIVGEGVFLIT